MERPTAPSSAAGSSDSRSIHLAFTSADQVHEGLENAVEALIETAAQDGACGLKTRLLGVSRATVYRVLAEDAS